MSDLSFCKFNFSKNSKKVIWEITNQCNYSCEYCIFSSTGKKPRGELSYEKAIQTLEELRLYGFNYIKFTGGEPFIREDFLNILNYAKKLNFDFDLSTNASFINEEISRKLHLLQLQFIHVSLDGYNLESHEFVRGKKSFDKTMAGLKNLLKYNKNIRLGCVIHSQNDNHLSKIVSLANQLKVKEIIFSMMSPIGRMDKNSTSVSQKSPQELIEIICQISSEYTKVNHNLRSDLQPISFTKSEKPCPGGDDFLFIDSIGTVSPCTWISEKLPQFHLLSLHQYTLGEILNHNLFKSFNTEKKLLKGQCPAFTYENKKQFDTIYSFATENIAFIDLLPKSLNNHALVITGSGDQAISLTLRNFKNITSIDINYLARFYAELKIAAIKTLSYQDFILFFKNNDNSFNYKLFKQFQNLLTPECEKFWNQQYINHHYNGKKIRNSSLFNLQHDNWNNKIANVPYLQSEEIYKKIKGNIQLTHFTFITDNFSTYQFDNTFDMILLSNISDYSHKMFNDDYIKEFKTYFVEKANFLLNKDGISMFSYVYDFENIGQSSIRNKINVPLIREMYFKEFNFKEAIVPSAIQNLKHDVICYIKK